MLTIDNDAPDCKDYVSEYLTNNGVGADQLYWRTNFNLGSDFGKICSFAIIGDRSPVFLIPNIELNAVQIVEFSRAVQNKNENKLVKRAEPVKVSAASKYLYRGEGEPIHSLTGVHEVREKYGLTGKGVRVAVVDTGVDYMHPALGGGFGAGYPVAYGYDLVGDEFHNGEFLNSVSDDDPLDNCSSESHGTHVAGIIVADSSRIQNASMLPPFPLTGAAPGVEIGAYRIFGCSGSTATDIVAAKMS